MDMAELKRDRKAATAAILIGIGMGGFLDGILLHQIFQWHNMLSNWLPPTTMEAMKYNMIWDGVFHAFVWTVTLVGIYLMWSAAYRGNVIPSFKVLIGQLLFGWGLFNLVEGIINHQILGIHYVRQVPNYSIYNLSFLAIGGVLLILVGLMLMKKGRKTSTSIPA